MTSRVRLLLVACALVIAVGALWRLGQGGRASGGVASSSRVVARRSMAQGPRSMARSGVEVTWRGPVTGEVAVCAWLDLGVAPADPVTCVHTTEGPVRLDLPPGAYRVTASSGPWAGSVAARVVPGKILEVVLELAPLPSHLAGEVVDATGGVVEGALVRAGDSVAMSDGDGRFHLAVAPGFSDLVVAAEGYAGAQLRIAAPTDAARVTLFPAASIAGRVVDSDGRGVPGALVGARQRWSRTDEAGSFRITGLLPGRFRLELRKEGLRGRVSPTVRLGLGEAREGIVIQVDPATRLHVQIEGPGRTGPCRSGRLRLRGPEQLSAPLGADGSARFPGVRPGVYESYLRCEQPAWEGALDDLQVPGASEASRSLRMPDGVRVEGCVEADEPGILVGMKVMMTGDGMERAVDELDAEGCFAFAAVPPGHKTITGEIFSGQGQSIVPQDVEVASRDVEVALEARPHGHVYGVLTDPEGEGRAGHRLRFEGEEQLAGTLAKSSGEAISVADGTFDAGWLPAGVYRVEVVDEAGMPRSVLGPRRVRVGPTDGEQVITVGAGDGEIEVRVLGPGGEPAADAIVALAREGRQRWKAEGLTSARSSVADGEGMVRFEDLASGVYDVEARLRGGVRAKARGVAVGAVVEIELGEEADLDVDVRRTDGTPLHEVTLFVRAAGAQWVEQLDGAAMPVRLESVPAGPAVFEAHGEDGSFGAVEIDLGQDEREVVQILLDPPIAARGRVLDAKTLRPVPGVFVLHRGRSVRTDGAGRFVVRLSPDDPRLRLSTGWAGAYLRRWVSLTAQGSAPGPDGVVDLGDIELQPSRPDR